MLKFMNLVYTTYLHTRKKLVVDIYLYNDFMPNATSFWKCPQHNICLRLISIYLKCKIYAKYKIVSFFFKS